MVHYIVTFAIKDCREQSRSAVDGAHSPHLQLCSIVWKLLPPPHLTTHPITKDPCKIRFFKSFHLTHKWKSQHNPTVQTFFLHNLYNTHWWYYNKETALLIQVQASQARICPSEFLFARNLRNSEKKKDKLNLLVKLSGSHWKKPCTHEDWL